MGERGRERRSRVLLVRTRILKRRLIYSNNECTINSPRKARLAPGERRDLRYIKRRRRRRRRRLERKKVREGGNRELNIKGSRVILKKKRYI